jgi:hypothetical protein
MLEMLLDVDSPYFALTCIFCCRPRPAGDKKDSQPDIFLETAAKPAHDSDAGNPKESLNSPEVALQ